MSIADRPVRAQCQRGFTLAEVAIAAGILALMALVVERTLTTTYDAERYLSAVRRVTERGQKVSSEVFDSVSASRKLFQAGTEGEDYLAALDANRDPLLSTARLPLIDEAGVLGPDDAGDPRTGSVLLFVRESDPAPCVADASTGRMRFIDTYRFVCIYPSQSPRRLVGDRPETAVDLVIWRSIPYPNFAQIQAIGDADERAAVAADLYARYAHDLAWDPTSPVDSAFHALDAFGNVAAVATPGILIEEDLDVSSRGQLVYADIQLAPTDPQSYYQRAMFSMDDAADWEPGGFEVKIAGASGSRKVWMHVVVESQATRGRTAIHANTLIASTRDL